jgi:serine protease
VVAVTPKVYLVFWGRQWSKDPAGAAPALQNFFKGLYGPDDTWGAILDQYCQGLAVGTVNCGSKGTHVEHPVKSPLAGVWFDKTAPAPTAATHAQMLAEVSNAASHFGNKTQSANQYAQYVIASPTGTIPDGLPNNGPGHPCAAHHSTVTTYGVVAYTNLPYLPDLGAPACGIQMRPATPLDVYLVMEGHEYAETLTDLWGNGWKDSANKEIGDKCEAGSGPDALLRLSTGTFPVQGLWSNQANSCVTTTSPQWSSQSTHPQAGTNTSPALAYYNGELYAAWEGTSGNAIFYSAYNGTKWTPQATISGTWGEALTSDPPALAVANGVLYAAWTGKGAGNVYYSSFKGKSWSAQAVVRASWGTASTDAAPSLGANGASLFLAYKIKGSTKVSYSSFWHGAWLSPSAVPGAATSVGPAVVGTPNAKYASFTFAWSTSGHEIDTRSLTALGWASIQVLPKASTSKTPALTMMDDNHTLVAAWKGLGSSTKVFYDYAYHFNGASDSFAAVQSEPQAGTDLAPALTSNGPTLVAAWRGTTSSAVFYSISTNPF